MTITIDYANITNEAQVALQRSFIKNDHRTPTLAEFFMSAVVRADNSLSNLNTLRGLRGAYPRVGVLGNPLARYSLSMRKLCLESYTLERIKKLDDDSFLKRLYHSRNKIQLDRSKM